jgi:hypothetical protein
MKLIIVMWTAAALATLTGIAVAQDATPTPAPAACTTPDGVRQDNPEGSKFVELDAAGVAKTRDLLMTKGVSVPDEVKRIIVGALPPDQHANMMFFFGFDKDNCLIGHIAVPPEFLLKVLGDGA